MDTLFFQEHKQHILLGAFVALLVVGLGVVWYTFFYTPVTPGRTEQPPPPRAIELNFGVFDDPAFRELGAPPRKIPAPSEVGRSNPFTPQ